MRKSQTHMGQPVRIKRWFNVGSSSPDRDGSCLPAPRDVLRPEPHMILSALVDPDVVLGQCPLPPRILYIFLHVDVKCKADG